MRRVAGIMTGLAVAAFLVGCGGGGYSTPQAAFDGMVAAAKAGNKEAWQACFDKETREAIVEMEKLVKEKGAKAPKAAKEESEGPEDFIKMMKEAKGANLKVEGDKATMDVTAEGETHPMAFVKEGGSWKISVPELKLAVGMMKAFSGMGEAMMKGMGEAVEKGMKEGVEKMGKGMEEAVEPPSKEEKK
jgi:hypothetical protein